MLFKIFLIINVHFVLAENILFVNLVPSPSHHIWNEALIEGLLSKNHNVTMIGFYPANIISNNYSILQINDEKFTENISSTLKNVIDETSVKSILSMWEFIQKSCEFNMNSEEFKALLNYPKSFFNLLIFDITFSECYLPLIDHFNNQPAIGVTAFGLQTYLNDIIGESIQIYTPYYGLPYTDKMNLFQRFCSIFYTTIERLSRFYYLPKLDEINKKVFGENVRKINELGNEISLIFPNDDPILDYPKPNVPNVIQIGGVHLKEINQSATKIDEDLEKILNNSVEGIVFVSLGSNFQPKFYKDHVKSAFIEAFSKLNQTILWKFDDIVTSKNVIIKNWFPQSDILAHSNTKLFITHCGALSSQETIFRGIPIIGIPLFHDQYYRSAKFEEIEAGIILNYKEITANKLYESINEVLMNSRYKENMMKLSSLYKNQPLKPLDKFLMWFDYLLKNGDLRNLSVAGRKMSWYQTNNYDILGLIVVIVVVVKMLVNKLVFNGGDKKEKTRTTLIMLKFFLVLISIQQITCKHILFINLVLSPSHHGWNEVLIEGLLSKNHNVTMIGYYEPKIKHPNYNVLQVDVKPFAQNVDAIYEQASADGSASIKSIFNLATFVENGCKYSLNTQQFKQLLGYPKDSFDLIIFDITLSECFLPLIDHFGLPPTVAVTAFGMNTYYNDIVGQSTENYIPYFGLPYTDQMSFFERMHNLFYLTMESIIRVNSIKKLNVISKESFGTKSRSIEDLFKEISLIFPNDNPILDYPRPTAPNVIPIGGVQVKPPKKLDKDLQKILDDSKQGVIFVSLGSNFLPKFYGKHVIKAFKESFSKLNQTVLWKFDDDGDLSKNIITRKWFPQSDILAHPNTKLFITHCGGLSTQETIIRGVPVIGIPLFADQFNRAGKYQSINGGVILKYSELTTDKVYNSIVEVLSNPVYKNNMKRCSMLYNEQPEKPMEKFLIWTDYILNNGHLKHLSLARREMRWYQVDNWDIFGFIIGVCLFLYVLLKKISCVILKMCKTDRKEKIN
ncbi:uncharacterized protein [Onthophagus taurus]|uniref:uncharacterized protein n=1 Tax=Onthophagus taurus TaxID=166361 RepID=UPI0039BDE72A